MRIHLFKNDHTAYKTKLNHRDWTCCHYVQKYLWFCHIVAKDANSEFSTFARLLINELMNFIQVLADAYFINPVVQHRNVGENLWKNFLLKIKDTFHWKGVHDLHLTPWGRERERKEPVTTATKLLVPSYYSSANTTP